jgi:hypothetical protein
LLDWKVVPLIYGQPVGTGPTVVEDGADELIDVELVETDIELIEDNIEVDVDDEEVENELNDIDG